jgi:AcrR family transcriptional regulator
MADTAATSLKRQEIVDQAYRLFYDGGFHATGVDAVMADTGISKRTLYKYFPSKEHLIEAVLAKYAGDVDDMLFNPAFARSDDPRERIRALFDVRRETMDGTKCQGCLAMKAAGEYAGKHDGITANGARSSNYIEQRFIDLCVKAGLADPALRGRQINLLFQGAIQTSQMRGNTGTFDAAKQAVELLLS